MKPFFTLVVIFLALLVSTHQSVAQCTPIINSNNTTIVGSCEDTNPIFDQVTAESDCCAISSIVSTVVETGNILSDCAVSPAFGPGPDWAFFLPGVSANVAWYFDDFGSMQQTADGHAVLTGHIYNVSNPAQGFNVTLLLENARNWEQWSALGRSYKDDLNISGNNHLEWTYYEMAANFSHLEGTGDLAGSSLQLSHKPSNYYYGFQVGQAANDKNTNFGISGWFYYSGMLNGQSVSGHGDINADLECGDIQTTCGSTEFTQFSYASDECGGFGYSSQVWSGLDNSAPVFDAYSETIEIACEDYTSISLSATDNCSGVSITFQDVIIEEGCNGIIQRTFTAVDGCGNTSTATITIQLIGDTAPEFVDFPENITVECGTWNENADPGITYTGGCAGLILTFEEIITPGDCDGQYTIDRVYTLSDDCDNVVSQTWTINIVDTTPPVLYNIPQDVTISCGEEVPIADVFALDNCLGVTPVGINANTVDIGCGYEFIRSWISTDGCGNSTIGTQVTMIIDDTPPVFTSVPESQVLQCSANDIPLEYPTAEDACSNFTITYVESTDTNGCESTITREFTATDLCGNSASILVVYTITDNELPQLIFSPGDVVFDCEVGEIPAPVAIDNCSDVEITYTDNLSGDCGGSFVRTYSISDACGNTINYVQSVSILDTEAPYVVFMPEDVILTCGEPFNPEEIQPVFADNCSNVTVQTLDNAIIEGDCPGEYTLILNWLVEDACGNSITSSLSIQYIDNVPPVFSNVPTDLEVECGADFDYQDATAFDDCSQMEVEVIYTEEYNFAPCGYVLTRTWTATDACGNSASVSQDVNFVDTTGPMFTEYPEDFTVYCGDVIPSTPIPTAVDECDGEVETSVTENIIPGNCAGEYYIQRLFRAFDACGNGAIYFQTVTVIDNVGPVFVNPQSFVQLTCTNNQLPLVNVVDECSSADVFFEDSDPAPLCGGTFERYYTAIDACGNVTTFTQTVQLIDETPPTFFNLPASSLTLECGSPVPDVFIFAQDNCSGITPIGLSANTVETDCGYIFTRTWITSDDCGNTTEFTQTVTTVDTTAPELSAYPADITIGCNENLPAIPQIIAEDACNGFVEVNFQEEIQGISACPTVVRTWCASDCSGNEVCHTQTITLIENVVVMFRVDPADMTNYNVKWSSSEEDNINCEVYNTAGQLVQTLYSGITAGGVVYNIPFNTSRLAPGIYIVKMNSSAGSETQRVIIK